MKVMQTGRAVRMTAAIAAAAAMLVLVPRAGLAYTPEQQQLCTNDAFRLCSADIPDEGRITACMMRQRSQLSPGCRALFNTPAPAAQRTARPAKPVKLQSAPGTTKPKTTKKKPTPAT